MKNNVLLDKSFQFSLSIIATCKDLMKNKREYVVSKQLLRSGTAIGANARESNHAESKPDFIHKLSISLKEAHESEYWIELLYQSKDLEEEEYKVLYESLNEIISLLTAIIKTSKRNLQDLKK